MPSWHAASSPLAPCQKPKWQQRRVLSITQCLGCIPPCCHARQGYLTKQKTSLCWTFCLAKTLKTTGSIPVIVAVHFINLKPQMFAPATLEAISSSTDILNTISPLQDIRASPVSPLATVHLQQYIGRKPALLQTPVETNCISTKHSAFCWTRVIGV